MFEVAFNNPRRSCWVTGPVAIRMEENKSGFRRKKMQRYWRGKLAVEKHNIKIGTLELSNLFHIIEYVKNNIGVATGVNRVGWRWR